jgi:hypothetical protein
MNVFITKEGAKIYFNDSGSHWRDWSSFSELVPNATLKIYPGAPHGMCTALKDQVNEDLLGFISG